MHSSKIFDYFSAVVYLCARNYLRISFGLTFTLELPELNKKSTSYNTCNRNNKHKNSVLILFNLH